MCPCVDGSARPSVRQRRHCPRDKLSPVQARSTKFEPEVQSTLVKIPFIWGWLTFTSKVKFNFKVGIYFILIWHLPLTGGTLPPNCVGNYNDIRSTLHTYIRGQGAVIRSRVIEHFGPFWGQIWQWTTLLQTEPTVQMNLMRSRVSRRSTSVLLVCGAPL